MKTLLGLLLLQSISAHAFSTCSWNTEGFAFTFITSNNNKAALLEMTPTMPTRVSNNSAAFEVKWDFAGEESIYEANYLKGDEMFMPSKLYYKIETHTSTCPRCGEYKSRITNYLVVMDENKAQLAKCLLD